MLVTLKFWIFCTRFGNLNYNIENIDPLNGCQIIWAKILKGDECLYCKSGSAICVSNSECDLCVINHRTLQFVKNIDEVSSFDERIKDSSLAET